MSAAISGALFCIAGLLAWGQSTDRLLLAGVLGAILAAIALAPYKVSSNDKAKSRVNDWSIVAVICAGLWYWLQRASLQTNFALHILSLCPIFLYPKLCFNLLQAGGAQAGASPTRDGANIARIHLAASFPFSRRSLDARAPMGFDSIYFLSAIFISCFYLPWRAALPLLALGVLPHAIMRGWRGSQKALGSASIAAAACACAIFLALAGGKAIEQGQDLAEDYFSQFWGRRSDAMPSGESTDTSIGRRGRIDNGSKLLARLEWSQPRGYLRNGVFSYTSNGITWFSHAPNQSSGDKPIYPVDGTTFALPAAAHAPKPGEGFVKTEQAKISMTFGRERMAIPVPVGATEIFGLPFAKLEVNAMGVAVAGGNPGFAKFGINYLRNSDDLPAPADVDLEVPQALASVLDRFISEAKLQELPPDKRPQAIREYFRDNWTYTLNLETQDGAPRSLTRFLTKDRQGHCEYFAAATTLALRRLGIPARYQTGFLVNEYDKSEQLFWIRSRDAHAWSSFWDGKAWTLLDSTPGGPPDDADWASTGSDWLARLQYIIEDFDAAALANSIDARLLWALGALVLAYVGLRMRLRRVSDKGTPESRESEKLTFKIQALTGELRASTETSYDFWLRCAPKLRASQGLIELAHEREQALFMPNSDARKSLADCDGKAKKIRSELRLAKPS